MGAATAPALYGGLQAGDGVATKQADLAWLNAPEAEQAARVASAEAIRWIERGLRSYHDHALGLALLLTGAAIAHAARIPRLVALLIGIYGVLYLVQGWSGSRGAPQVASSPSCWPGW